MLWTIPDICRRIFPAVTPGLDQPNVLAEPDSRSHAEYITQAESGRTMRDGRIPTLKMMSSHCTFKCHCTIYEEKCPWHTK